MSGYSVQDSEPVVIRKKAPTAAARKDEKAVNATRRAGGEIETVLKATAGSNKAASSSTFLNTRKLDEETENLTYVKIPSELKISIMQGLTDKKLTKAQLGQVLQKKKVQTRTPLREIAVGDEYSDPNTTTYKECEDDICDDYNDNDLEDDMCIISEGDDFNEDILNVNLDNAPAGPSSVSAASHVYDTLEYGSSPWFEEAEAVTQFKGELSTYKTVDSNRGLNPWEKLLAYDACIRLCPNASARGCTTANLFLNNGCWLLCHTFHSIELPSITAEVYSTEICERLKIFLASWPPPNPQPPHIKELIVTTFDFERNLKSWKISLPKGAKDSRYLFHDYIMGWIREMQVSLQGLCKAEKAHWAGVVTNHCTSPFAEEVYNKVDEMLSGYEIVVYLWPEYTLTLENAVANVEIAILNSLEKQYIDVLKPLRGNIFENTVLRLSGRQNAVYSVPNQLGTFLNTMIRVVDLLHYRVEEKMKTWAVHSSASSDVKSKYGDRMNEITALLSYKYKEYMQAVIVKLTSNMQGSDSTRLRRIIYATKAGDGDVEIRERMETLCFQLMESVSNLHDVFTNQVFISCCRALWDRMGQIVLKVIKESKKNPVLNCGSHYALAILDDTFSSHMRMLQGNELHKDIEPPPAMIEGRAILGRNSNAVASAYFY